jgi:pyruvate formate lyase activating enzyme
VDYEYRTTVAKWLHSAEDIEAMACYIRWAKNYFLQNYVWGNTLDPDFGGEPFNDDELLEFQKIAGKYVKNVKIRN